MSRKRAKKSNTVPIGIFTDRSSQYNQAILETLYNLDQATAWVIAEYLLKKINPKTDKEPHGPGTAIFYRTQKIYSVIQRKTGRLNDLASKGYIEEKDGLWKNTLKGVIALAIKKPELLDRGSQKQEIEDLRKVVNTMPDDIARYPLGISVNHLEYKKGINKVLDDLKNDPQIFKLVIEETKEMLLNGIDLDRIDERTLTSLLFNRKKIKKLTKRWLSEKN